MTRIVLRLLGALFGLALLVLLLAAFAAWLVVRPMAGEWTTSLPLARGVSVTVGVARLIEAATDPRYAPWLDGRTLRSPMGPLTLHWHAPSNTLRVRCAPCAWRVPALGDEPLRMPEATLSVRRDGGALHGELASAGTVWPWKGRLSKSSLVLNGDLGPRPVADVYRVFAAVVPEAGRARIGGQLGGRWQLALPKRQWTVQPVLSGFTVEGLGTEALQHVEVPPRCAPGTRRAPSPWVAKAVIAAEDQRFFEHPGYDLDELLASLALNQRAGAVRRGGSTLTQQLAKLLYTGDDRSAARKLRELLYAVEMERTLGKARILRLYLSLAPWGEGACGVQQAARVHLGKAARDLDPVEAAWLASLLRRPASAGEPVDRERLAWIVKALPVVDGQERRERLARAAEWMPPARP